MPTRRPNALTEIKRNLPLREIEYCFLSGGAGQSLREVGGASNTNSHIHNLCFSGTDKCSTERSNFRQRRMAVARTRVAKFRSRDDVDLFRPRQPRPLMGTKGTYLTEPDSFRLWR